MPRAAELLAAMQRLPAGDRHWITGGRPILIVAPHPDDETFGCGGLIAEACAHGEAVHIAVLTDGTRSHPNSPSYPPPRLKALREQEARAAAAVLGVPDGRLHFFGLRDGAAPHGGAEFDSVVDRLIALIRSAAAATVCATWSVDPHPDHVAAHLLAAAAACRSGVRHLAYPIWAWVMPDEHEVPETSIRGIRLDITRHLSVKRRAIAAYPSQLGGLITDDPDGVGLPPDLVAKFHQPFELFLDVS
jgi:LmbE family N-acetylglucosaminyl deacetylase